MYGNKAKIGKYVYGKETKTDETHAFELCDGMPQAWHFLF